MKINAQCRFSTAATPEKSLLLTDNITHDLALWEPTTVRRQSVASTQPESKTGGAAFCLATSLQTTAGFMSGTHCEEDETRESGWC